MLSTIFFQHASTSNKFTFVAFKIWWEFCNHAMVALEANSRLNFMVEFAMSIETSLVLFQKLCAFFLSFSNLWLSGRGTAISEDGVCLNPEWCTWKHWRKHSEIHGFLVIFTSLLGSLGIETNMNLLRNWSWSSMSLPALASTPVHEAIGMAALFWARQFHFLAKMVCTFTKGLEDSLNRF